MGADSEGKASQEGDWAETGFVVCAEKMYPKFASQSASDRATPTEIEKQQELDYPEKALPSAAPDKGTK